MKIPYETFKNPVCKGCKSLNTACGTCEMCLWIKFSKYDKVPVIEMTANVALKKYVENALESTKKYCDQMDELHSLMEQLGVLLCDSDGNMRPTHEVYKDVAVAMGGWEADSVANTHTPKHVDAEMQQGGAKCQQH